MKQTTKRILGIAAASALIIGAANGVLAHGFGPGFAPGWGGHQGMMGGPGSMHGPFGGPGQMMGADLAAYSDQRLAELKTRLGITPEQESAWDTYADAVEAKAALMTSHRSAMTGADSIGPDQRQAFHQQGLEQMQSVQDAARGLYAVLSPEQQTVAGTLIGGPCLAR
jgi:protein CpxP